MSWWFIQREPPPPPPTSAGMVYNSEQGSWTPFTNQGGCIPPSNLIRNKRMDGWTKAKGKYIPGGKNSWNVAKRHLHQRDRIFWLQTFLLSAEGHYWMSPGAPCRPQKAETGPWAKVQANKTANRLDDKRQPSNAWFSVDQALIKECSPALQWFKP